MQFYLTAVTIFTRAIIKLDHNATESLTFNDSILLRTQEVLVKVRVAGGSTSISSSRSIRGAVVFVVVVVEAPLAADLCKQNLGYRCSRMTTVVSSETHIKLSAFATKKRGLLNRLSMRNVKVVQPQAGQYTASCRTL